MRIGVGLWQYGKGGGGFTPVIPVNPGPMDVVIPGRNVFTNFSREFNLAYPDVVFYLACHYTGDPVISIAHGGEPLTIVQQERQPIGGIMSLIAVGRGLTIEPANLTITATGGELDGGACRINEMLDMQPTSTGWTYGDLGVGNAPNVTVENTTGGTLKANYARRFVDTGHYIGIKGMETKFKGFTIAGDEIPYDVSVNSGNWVLGEGWSIVGDKLVHTGAQETTCTLTLPEPRLGSQGRRAFIECVGRSSGWISSTNVTNYGIGVIGPNSGYVCTGATGSINTVTVGAKGDVSISQIQWFENDSPISWAFCSAPAVNGQVLEMFNLYAPSWTISLAEIFADDY